MATLRVLRITVGVVFSHLSTALLTSILAMLLSLPILFILSVVSSRGTLSVLPLGVTILVSVLPIPAAAGLQTVARGLTRAEYTVLSDFWDGLKQHSLPAAVAWLFGLVVTAVIAANVAFYAGILTGTRPLGPASWPVEVVWLALLVLWLSAHLYIYPLLLAQEKPSVLLAYRNAAVIVLARPLFSVAVAAIWIGVMLVLSALGLIAVGGLALGAVMQQAAFAETLPRFVRSDQSSNTGG